MKIQIASNREHAREVWAKHQDVLPVQEVKRVMTMFPGSSVQEFEIADAAKPGKL